MGKEAATSRQNQITLSNKRIFIVLPILVIVFLVLALLLNDISSSIASRDVEIKIDKKKETKTLVVDNLLAKSVLVYDFSTNTILFEKNAESQLPLASLTKLMTVFVAAETLSSYVYIPIDEYDIIVEGDSGLKAGERWKLRDLIDITLLTSSNDGAHALAAAVESQYRGRNFLSIINETADDINLTQTYFINESGLDNSKSVSGGYGSARDIAFLLKTILTEKPEILESTRSQELHVRAVESEEERLFENTNPDVANIPGLIGSKTGFTDLAGGNLAIVFDVGIGHPIAAIVLGSKQEEKFEDMQKLVKATIKHFAPFGL